MRLPTSDLTHGLPCRTAILQFVADRILYYQTREVFCIGDCEHRQTKYVRQTYYDSSLPESSTHIITPPILKDFHSQRAQLTELSDIGLGSVLAVLYFRV